MVDIEKPWEKENLGLTSVEYVFDRNDVLNEDIFSRIQNSVYDYKVCRLYAEQMDLAYRLQNMRFRFAEATVVMDCRLNDLTLSKSYQKYIGMINAVKADAGDMELIVSEIKKGMYDNDRIALDPNLGVEKSRIRFSNWLLQEELSDRTNIFVLLIKGVPFGYFAVKSINEREASSIQAGLFSDYRSSGLGFATLYYPMVIAKQQGKAKISTEVSSNNVISVRTHLSVGYKLKDLKYVFVRHDHLLR